MPDDEQYEGGLFKDMGALDRKPTERELNREALKALIAHLKKTDRAIPMLELAAVVRPVLGLKALRMERFEQIIQPALDANVLMKDTRTKDPKLAYTGSGSEPVPEDTTETADDRALAALVDYLKGLGGKGKMMIDLTSVVRPALGVKALRMDRFEQIIAPALEKGILAKNDKLKYPTLAYVGKEEPTKPEPKPTPEKKSRPLPEPVSLQQIIDKVQAIPHAEMKQKYMPCGHMRHSRREIITTNIDEHGKVQFVHTGEFECLACKKGEPGDPRYMDSDEPLPPEQRRNLELTRKSEYGSGFCFHPTTGKYIGGPTNNCREHGPERGGKRVLCPVHRKLADEDR